MVSEAVFIAGRSGVGKTSVGFEIHARLSSARIPHCVIDGDFLDMAYPPPWEHKLAERNLAAMWGNYRALGYRRIIYTNTVCALPEVIKQLTDAMGDDPKIIAILLMCSNTTARERLCRRETGFTFNQHLESSAKMAELLESSTPGWVHRVPTDDRSVSAIAEEVIELSGWLPNAP